MTRPTLKKILSVVLAAALALFVLPAAACTGGTESNDVDDGGVTVETPIEGGTVTMVSRISIDISDGALQLPYTLTDGDGPVTFVSDYASVAAVDASGKLYPVAAGVANITAKTATSSKTFEVNVTNIYSSYTKLRTAEDIENLIKTKGYTKTNNKYCLANDIDFGGKQIEPLGSWGGADAFNAVFDGRGYALKNFKIDKPEACKTVDENTGEAQYFGVSLFPYVGKGTIRNLNLIGVYYEGYGFTGGVAGQVESGRIENCFVQGVINSTSGFASSVPSGGVCGIIGKNAVVKDNFIDLDILGGFVFAGFNFGEGSNCVARAQSITAVRNGEELMFQTDNTGKSGEEGAAENAELTEFDKNTCRLLAENQLTNLKNYTFSDDSNWAFMQGYMAFIARPDGIAPDWAAIDLS